MPAVCDGSGNGCDGRSWLKGGGDCSAPVALVVVAYAIQG